MLDQRRRGLQVRGLGPLPLNAASASPPVVADALAVAAFAPLLVGLNAALNVQSAPAANTTVQLSSEITKWLSSAPVSDTDTTTGGDVTGFVIPVLGGSSQDDERLDTASIHTYASASSAPGR